MRIALLLYWYSITASAVRGNLALLDFNIKFNRMVVDTVRILVGNRIGIVGDAFEMQGVTCCVAIELIVFLDEFTLPRLTLYNLFKSIVKHI